MALYKSIEHGKDYRQVYRGAKAHSVSCRNHGTCDYCKANRLHANKVRASKYVAIDEFINL